jgi:hypothetical protein
MGHQWLLSEDAILCYNLYHAGNMLNTIHVLLRLIQSIFLSKQNKTHVAFPGNQLGGGGGRQDYSPGELHRKIGLGPQPW